MQGQSFAWRPRKESLSARAVVMLKSPALKIAIVSKGMMGSRVKTANQAGPEIHMQTRWSAGSRKSKRNSNYGSYGRGVQVPIHNQ